MDEAEVAQPMLVVRLGAKAVEANAVVTTHQKLCVANTGSGVKVPINAPGHGIVPGKTILLHLVQHILLNETMTSLLILLLFYIPTMMTN